MLQEAIANLKAWSALKTTIGRFLWPPCDDLSPSTIGAQVLFLSNAHHRRNGLQVELHVGVEPRGVAGRLQGVLASVEIFADCRLFGDLGHDVVHQLGVDKSGRVSPEILRKQQKV